MAQPENRLEGAPEHTAVGVDGVERQLQPAAVSQRVAASKAAAEKRTAKAMSADERAIKRRADQRRRRAKASGSDLGCGIGHEAFESQTSGHALATVQRRRKFAGAVPKPEPGGAPPGTLTRKLLDIRASARTRARPTYRHTWLGDTVHPHCRLDRLHPGRRAPGLHAGALGTGRWSGTCPTPG